MEISEERDEYFHEAEPTTAHRRRVVSSNPPDAQLERLLAEKKDNALEMENKVLKRKVELLMTEVERFKADKAIRNGDHQKNQLLHCRHELSVLVKKMGLQGKELRRASSLNEALREELESAKKKLQSAKQRAVGQRAEQHHLKERLDQAVRERDGLNVTLLHCRKGCSELRDTISERQSSANKKDGHCKRQTKEIHLLKLENQQLERERGMAGGDAEGWRRELRKCEEELHALKEKLEESRKVRAIGDDMGKEILIVQQRSHGVRRPGQEAPPRQLESVRKELLDRTEELRKARELCEELKEKLTEVAARCQLSQAAARDLREKIKSVTAQRNMYRGLTEKLGVELEDFKKGQRKTRRTKITKRSSGDISS